MSRNIAVGPIERVAFRELRQSLCQSERGHFRLGKRVEGLPLSGDEVELFRWNSALARLSPPTPQTVSVIVGNLKKSGAGASSGSKITKSGQRILDRCKPPVQALEERLSAGLTLKEQEIVRRWLVAIALDG